MSPDNYAEEIKNIAKDQAIKDFRKVIPGEYKFENGKLVLEWNNDANSFKTSNALSKMSNVQMKITEILPKYGIYGLVNGKECFAGKNYIANPINYYKEGQIVNVNIAAKTNEKGYNLVIIL